MVGLVEDVFRAPDGTPKEDLSYQVRTCPAPGHCQRVHLALTRRGAMCGTGGKRVLRLLGAGDV